MLCNKYYLLKYYFMMFCWNISFIKLRLTICFRIEHFVIWCWNRICQVSHSLSQSFSEPYTELLRKKTSPNEMKIREHHCSSNAIYYDFESVIVTYPINWKLWYWKGRSYKDMWYHLWINKNVLKEDFKHHQNYQILITQFISLNI